MCIRDRRSSGASSSANGAAPGIEASMSEEEESPVKELTYVGQPNSFVEARGAARNFNRSHVALPSAKAP
eukprot:1093010-Prorocentrum_lima.AAC.1